MARATRSTTQGDKEKPQDTATTTRKAGSKKRKRNSIPENGEHPAAKQVRTDDIQEAEQPVDAVEPKPQGSGDVPIDPSEAQKILDVLEMVDTQGLLDRVFPLQAQVTEPKSPDDLSMPSTSSQTFSFRNLLKDSGQYPLRVLRSAVQHLFPISSHPRSHPSPTVVQQLRFCKLALSLLDLASFHSVPPPSEVESVFPALFNDPASTESDTKPVQPSPSPVQTRKYALVQHLPTGDWWTSLNSDIAPSTDGRELKGLPTAHAELVAILPSASTSTYPEKTLSAYVSKKPSTVLQQIPGPRRVSCGKFLDYGPYASFAPSFDQEGVEVGRDTLGEVIWYQREKARLREKVKGKQRALPVPEDGVESDGVISGNRSPEADDENGGQNKVGEADDQQDFESVLESLLPPDEVAAIKSALGSLELEQAVQELLDRNARALLRLQRLQRERLSTEAGGSSKVEGGSEEWDTAQAITDSLTLLASLRPRSSADDESKPPPFVPPPSVLRTLQRTLPVQATQGWYGTLPPSRTTAMRDDTTVQVKPGVPAPPPTATAAAAAAVTPAKPVAASSPYPPYNYGNYAQSQYRGGYGTYTPGQAGTYYPNYATPAQGQAAGSTQYPSQQYPLGAQYPYWYNYPHATPTQAGSTAGSTSGRATPQPAASTPAGAMPTSYAGFFASTTQQPQPQRAVANTVLTANAMKNYQPGAWSASSTAPGYVAPTLPAHLRGAVGATSTPGTPQPTTPSGATYPAHSGFYGNYPHTPAAR